MRILGPNATISDFRLDLVFLEARLRADGREAFIALAERAKAAKNALLLDREGLEAAEEQLTIAMAIVAARDAELDDEERRFALAAKLAGADKTLFPVPTHKLVSAPIDEEIQLVRNQIAKLGQRAADDELRTTWEPVLTSAVNALVAARDAKSTEQSDLAVARSRVAERKNAVDTTRVEIWGAINTALGDKRAADGFYRAQPRPEKKAAPTGQ